MMLTIRVPRVASLRRNDGELLRLAELRWQRPKTTDCCVPDVATYQVSQPLTTRCRQQHTSLAQTAQLTNTNSFYLT